MVNPYFVHNFAEIKLLNYILTSMEQTCVPTSTPVVMLGYEIVESNSIGRSA